MVTQVCPGAGRSAIGLCNWIKSDMVASQTLEAALYGGEYRPLDVCHLVSAQVNLRSDDDVRIQLAQSHTQVRLGHAVAVAARRVEVGDARVDGVGDTVDDFAFDPRG